MNHSHCACMIILFLCLLHWSAAQRWCLGMHCNLIRWVPCDLHHLLSKVETHLHLPIKGMTREDDKGPSIPQSLPFPQLPSDEDVQVCPFCIRQGSMGNFECSFLFCLFLSANWFPVFCFVGLWQLQGWRTVSEKSKMCYMNQIKKIPVNSCGSFICFKLLPHEWCCVLR